MPIPYENDRFLFTLICFPSGIHTKCFIDLVVVYISLKDMSVEVAAEAVYKLPTFLSITTFLGCSRGQMAVNSVSNIDSIGEKICHCCGTQ